MKHKKTSFFFILCVGILLASCIDESNKVSELKTTMDFNQDWNFALLDSNGVRMADWESVSLPHDWSVSFPFDENLEGCTGYLPGGTGLYQKQFEQKLGKDQEYYLLFDGVYNNSEVFLNDERLGFHPYGYSPFYFNITEYLNSGEEPNLLKVKVDRTRYADSRWYTGSGIYRNVKLVTKNKLHIPIWGVFVTTPVVSKESAVLNNQITVKNSFGESKSFTVEVTVYDQAKVPVLQASADASIAAGKEQVLNIQAELTNPKLWDLESPYLYEVRTSVVQNGEIVDQQTTKLGVRSIKFDTKKGFFLNGKNRKIKGVCLHHDGGLVGAAVPKGVWKRRLQKLRDAGCNAIRISHNPGSQEFLDLCDEMGFLVQDEFFDEWDNPKDKRLNMNERTSTDYITRGYTEHFQEWAERDLKNTILSHRNHPSIIQWSIGNEIEWTYPRNGDATGFFNNMHWSGNYFWSEPPNSPEQIAEQLKTLPRGKYDIGETAQKLAKWTKELDTTRYVIANCILPSSSYESGYVDALDMVGYSYRRVLYDYGSENYPEKPIMGTENLPQWHEWKAVMERPFISGTFLWTGIDYMGESNGGWPRKGTQSGLLDFAGFDKPSYHMFKTLWGDGPHVYITTQNLEGSIYKLDGAGEPVEKTEGAWKHALWFWQNVNPHWNYKDGESTVVEVYSNCEEVELFLDDQSLGKKRLDSFEDRILKWSVPFQPGALKAVGLNGGKVVKEYIVSTASEPAGIQLELDNSELNADGYDVAHIVAQLVDSNGNPVKHEEREITFTVGEGVKLLGVDNGWANNVQTYQSNIITTHNGRCLLLVQSKEKGASVEITANSSDLQSASVQLNVK